MSELKPEPVIYNKNPPVEIKGGMTLRDYFAAHVLMGMYAGDYDLNVRERAEAAYETADAMLIERLLKRKYR